MAYLQDETGITLTEVLAVIVLLSIVTTLLTTVASHMFTVRNLQETKIKAQRIANRLYADLNMISNESLVNVKRGGVKSDEHSLGESGKYRTVSGGTVWSDPLRKMVDILDPKTIVGENSLPYDPSLPYLGLSYYDNGLTEMFVVSKTDRTKAITYKTPAKDILLKVYLVKNKQEDQVLKQGESNYRDSFSVQTTVYVVFYKAYINWRNYISAENEPMKLDEVKRDNGKNIVYSRVFDISYRDDAKSAGEVAGNGRW